MAHGFVSVTKMTACKSMLFHSIDLWDFCTKSQDACEHKIYVMLRSGDFLELALIMTEGGSLLKIRPFFWLSEECK